MLLWLARDAARGRRHPARRERRDAQRRADARRALMTIQAGIGIVDAAASDAAAARAAAPGDWHRGAHRRGDPCRTAVVRADRAAADAASPPTRSHPARNAMIELTQPRRHRRPDAWCTARPMRSTSSFCEADRGAVRDAARCAGARRGADRAGADVLGRRRSAAAGRWRRRLCAPLSAGAAPALRHGVLLSEARGRRGQRPCHRRRLRAGNAAPTAASPRATAAASASPSCWSACRFRRWPSR